MCKKCAELKKIWEEALKIAWEETDYLPKDYSTKIKSANAAYDVYHAQAMKHAHHKEDA